MILALLVLKNGAKKLLLPQMQNFVDFSINDVESHRYQVTSNLLYYNVIYLRQCESVLFAELEIKLVLIIIYNEGPEWDSPQPLVLTKLYLIFTTRKCFLLEKTLS